MGFFIYVHGKDTNRWASSLDAALLTAMSYKYEGPNCRAQDYMGRILGIYMGEE